VVVGVVLNVVGAVDKEAVVTFSTVVLVVTESLAGSADSGEPVTIDGDLERDAEEGLIPCMLSTPELKPKEAEATVAAAAAIAALAAAIPFA